MERVRVGEWVALLGALGLLGLLFLDWFGVDVAAPLRQGGGAGLDLVRLRYNGSLTGWSTLGTFMDVLLGAAILSGLALAAVTFSATPPVSPVGAAFVALALGAAVLLILAVRLSSLAEDGPGIRVVVQLPAYLGLVFAALIPIGGGLSLRDERGR
jgi:hypothetical protein